MDVKGATARAGPAVGLFGVSVLVGALLGFATSVVFLLIIGVPVTAILIGVRGLRSEPRDESSAAVGAGLLVGCGGLYLLGAINTLISCTDTTVCGGASAVPFLAWALGIVGIGVAIAGVTFARRR